MILKLKDGRRILFLATYAGASQEPRLSAKDLSTGRLYGHAMALQLLGPYQAAAWRAGLELTTNYSL